MGRRGPKPQPTQLKILRGNPGHRPINKSGEPQPRNPGRIIVPDWLLPEAKALYAKHARELLDLRLLTVLDEALLAMACQHFGHYLECERVIAEKGRTMTVTTKSGEWEQARPEVGMALKHYAAYRQGVSEFGLSPAARVGLPVPEPRTDSVSQYARRREASGSESA